MFRKHLKLVQSSTGSQVEASVFPKSQQMLKRLISQHPVKLNIFYWSQAKKYRIKIQSAWHFNIALSLYYT